MIRQRWLLSVGVNDYGAQVRLPNLHCAVNDACLVYQRLVEQYNFQGALLAHPRDVALGPHASLNASIGGPGSAEDIIEQINRLRRRMSETDLFLLFYAGHGSPRAPGYLIPYGATHDRPSTHLMYRTLFGELSALPCRFQVLLLDCCYAGLALRSGGTPTDASSDGRAVVLAATEAGAVTPDRIPGVGDGNHSPFATAVAEFLCERISPGQAFEPEDLHAYVRDRVKHLTPPDLVAAGAIPCFRDEAAEIRPGRARLEIRRPGLALPGCRRYTCKVGERLILERPVRRNDAGGSPLEWKVITRNAGFDSGEQEREVRDLEHLRFEFAGDYDLQLVVRDPDTCEETSVTITVRVEEVKPTPLGLSSKPLPVCLAGNRYQAVVDVEGGLPPYGDLAVTGLPPGFTWAWECPRPGRTATGVRLEGFVPEAPEAGMPNSPDGHPVAFNVRLGVADTAGARAIACKRLLVISPKDYCHIEAGPFQVGYRAHLQKEKCIVHMLTCLAGSLNSLKSHDAKLPASVKAVVDKIGRGLADDAVRQVLQVNPGAEVLKDEAFKRGVFEEVLGARDDEV
ncbi:MAG TPA: caspase family protein, partial [Candidatus Paceibacterota bacterium]|nr:caspase family protein [Candidatus Paceibacterota bacterium]